MKKISITYIIQALCIGCILIPILLISFYTIPSNDDFSTMVDVINKMKETGEGIFGSALLLTVGRFRSWGGFYSGSFLNYAINPYMRWGITGYQVTIFLINLFWAVSLFSFTYTLLKDVFHIKSIKTCLWMYILLLTCFYNIYYYTETTYWYCTAVSYVLLTGFMLSGIVFNLKYMVTDKKKYAILGMLFGIIASGGSLNLVALNCGMALLIIGYGITIGKAKNALAYFISSLAGGILNVCAPGNFVRHGEVTDSYQITESVVYSLKHIIHRIGYLVKYTPLILIFMISFFYLLNKVDFQKIKFRFRYLIMFFGIIIVGGTIVNFPVIFGYGSNYFPDRCLYIEDYVIYLGLFICMIYFAGWCKQRELDKNIKFNIIILAVLCLYLVCGRSMVVSNIENCLSVKCSQEIIDGKVNNYYDYWCSVLNEIAESQEKNVIIEREQLTNSSNILQSISLIEDENNWVNKVVAYYYGKEKVRFLID